MNVHSELILIGRVKYEKKGFTFSSGQIWCAQEKTLFVEGKQTQAGGRLGVVILKIFYRIRFHKKRKIFK